MGTGRDKRKKAKEKKGEAPAGTGATKTERKTARNAQKAERRAERALAGDEDDIDALLASFALADKARRETILEPDCVPPSPRVNGSLCAYITPKARELVLFGGEYADLATNKVHVNADLYRFDVDRRKWTRVRAPGGPSPRCAHQAVMYKGCMYVWGGEFSSPNQERFMHFRDLWRLDLTTNEWDCLPTRGGPSARSGHRMALHKGGRALLFGGFYDTGSDVKYYNDLWELDLNEIAWRPLGPPPAAGMRMLAPRSGVGLAVVPGAAASAAGGGGGGGASGSGRGGASGGGDVLLVYGGYSKDEREAAAAAAQKGGGKKGGGGGGDDSDEDVERGRAHDDMWAFDLAAGSWECVKKAGMAPGPRASFGWFAHTSAKGAARAFLFGGVSDNEAKGGEDLSSEFHNDLYVFNAASRRWFAAEVRPPAAKKGGGGGAAGGGAEQQQQQESEAAAAEGGGGGGGAGPSGSGQPAADPKLAALMEAGRNKDSPIYKAAVRIQARFRGFAVRKAFKLYKVGGVVSELLYSPAAYGLDLSVRNAPKPRARISPQVCVAGAALWLLGGTVEVGDREITLDDMWTLDLVKLDGWNLVQENTVGEDVFKEAAAAAGAGSSSDEGDDG